MNNEARCFKVLNIYGGGCVPLYKPNIEEIIKIDATVKISKKTLITISNPCAIGVSLEGQIRTNHKLILEGDINYNIKYSTETIQQGIHNIQVSIPFCNYIALPNKMNSQSFIHPNVIVQDVYLENLHNRYFYINVILMLLVDIY